MSSQIQQIPLDIIGRYGLDTQTTPTTLSPEWLTAADNITYTEGGKITFRKGFNQKTLTSTDGKIGAISEFQDKIFGATGGNIYELDLVDKDDAFINGFETGNTNSDWQFATFKKRFFGVQNGSVPVRYDDVNGWKTLEAYDASTAPNGIVDFDKPSTIGTFDPSCFCAYYGRLWTGGVTEENDVVFFSEVGNEEDFNSVNAGFLAPSEVWGNDEITAIAPFGGKLAVFGKNNIILYDNPHEPTTMVLDEVISGIGCISRDSVQAVGDDLFFLSDTGVRSLFRTANKDKLPMQEKSLTIKDDMIGRIKQDSEAKSVYMFDEGLYVLSFVNLNISYVFDLSSMTPKDTPRVTTWSFNGDKQISCLAYTEAYGLLSGQRVGRVAVYEGYYDTTYIGDDGDPDSPVYTENTFKAKFSTPWLSMNESGVSVLLKKLKFIVDGGQGTPMSVRLYKDFGITPSFNQTIKINPVQSGALFLWGKLNTRWGSITSTHTHDAAVHPIDTKYAPIFGFAEKSIPVSGNARYLRIEMDAEPSGYKASLQGMSLLFKQGKIR